MSQDFHIPEIAQAELLAFHEAHFSQHALDEFQTTFLDGTRRGAHVMKPIDITNVESDDGDVWPCVERDLAEDAHFAALDLGEAYPGELSGEVSGEVSGEFASASAGDNLLSEALEAPDVAKKATQKKKRRRKNNNARRAVEKPDLRKRTWDVVDPGWGSLDYDGAEQDQVAGPAVPQRRQVTYDD